MLSIIPSPGPAHDTTSTTPRHSTLAHDTVAVTYDPKGRSAPATVRTTTPHHTHAGHS